MSPVRASWHQRYRGKRMSASQALDAVHSGDRVWIQSCCGTPSFLVDALVAHAPHVRDVEVVHMMTLGSADYTLPEYEGHFRHRRSALSTGTGRFCSARPLS